MQVEQVDFVSVPTHDLRRSTAWYHDVLGLPESEFSEGEVETPNVTLVFWEPEEQGVTFVPNQNGIALRVADVEAAVAWYTQHLGFALLNNRAPAFADVQKGALRLLLSGPTSSAGRPMPDGEQPGPGGWNRIHLIVDDLPAEVTRLRTAGVSFRNDIVTGPGGKQILVEDPASNLIEIFEAASR